MSLRLSVVVPSYRRPGDLSRCLEALAAQGRAADELLVVLREDDHASRELVAARRGATLVTVTEPGVLAAMAAGAAASHGEVICFTDDDAAPLPDWLERIEATLEAHPELAGVGGRDLIHEPNGELRVEPLSEVVGKVHRYGRIEGNHHRGRGGLREVDVLKGVNCAYRREFFALPIGLRGGGATVHFEVAVGAEVARRGGRLGYDPAIAVDHHPAPRPLDAMGREPQSRREAAQHVYNLAAAAGVRSTPRLLARVAYSCAWGEPAMPGLLRALWLLLHGQASALGKTAATISGNAAALRDACLGRSLRFTTTPLVG